MNILLVNPPNCGRSIPEENYGISTMKMVFRGEPLCLETLAGNLDGHAVWIADLKADPLALESGRLPFSPDLIGLTGVTCEANTVLSLAETLKSRFGATLVVGGHHASCDPLFFSRPFVDHVVVGIGKSSFRELVDALEKGLRADIPGIVNLQDGIPAPFIPRQYTSADLVDEKAPRYDLVSQHRDLYVMSGVGEKVGFVASAAGCTHGCAFCCIPSVTGGRYLLHSTVAVIRDIQALPDVSTIRLVDAHTFGNAKTAENLARQLTAAGIQKPLVADVRADTVVRHPELFSLWRTVGLRVAVIGFEEIDDERLMMLDKRSSVQTHIAATRILNDIGIRIVGDFIVSPDYTENDFDRLTAFIDTSGIDLPLPAVLTPIPGTPLHRKLKSDIRIDDLDYYTFTNAVIPTHLPEERFYRRYAALLDQCLAHFHQPQKPHSP
ncbi:B12-binding domain-containing radical SAM protein [Desulfosarcina sp. OttesenSCG-928-B08]|nr:B12-binding domain-containing radical SAM protein [Desulfosarcina sp. OttesenSCG-928-B08]